MPGDVFISYASQDKAVADAVCAALESAGVECWIAPRDVTPGEFYADSIVGAINATRVLIVVLTENAGASPHVLREVERASAKRHPVVTFRIDAASLPAGLEYFLSASHWLDATSSGIEGSLPELVRAVQRLVAPPADVEPKSARSTTKPATDLFPRPPATKSSPRLSRPLLAVMAVIAVVVAYLVADKLWLSRHLAGEQPVAAGTAATAPASSVISEKSVAVLPFVDMSEKHDQEYFSDGLSEELIDHLAHSQGLKVIARTSSFAFKGKNEDMRVIGERLGVANLLEGSVRRSGNIIRVTAQLINAIDGAHRWSDTYDRRMDDIFKVQDEIAAAVVAALKVSLAGESVSHAHFTPNIDAYTEYLQGKQLMRIASTKEEDEKTIAFFRRSVRTDPTFSDGWFFLAASLSNEIIDGYVTPNAVAAEMLRATREVSRLAPDSSIAHQASANTYWSLDRNPTAAAAEYRRAYERDPNDYALTRQLGDVALVVADDVALATRLYQKSLSLDPLAPTNYWAIAGFYYSQGRFKDAEAAIAKLRALAPTGTGYDSFLCAVFVASGRPAEALAAAERETDVGQRRWALALAYQALDRRQEAAAALADAEKNNALSDPLGIAELHAFRGDNDQAFAWLERAYQSQYFLLAGMKYEPLLKGLRGDPRWKPLLLKMKLPQ